MTIWTAPPAGTAVLVTTVKLWRLGNAALSSEFITEADVSASSVYVTVIDEKFVYPWIWTPHPPNVPAKGQFFIGPTLT